MNKERFLTGMKNRLATGARTVTAGVFLGGFASGFNPAPEVSTTTQLNENEPHLVLDKSPFNSDNFPLTGLNLSTEDADKFAMTAFVSAYMVGVLTQVRKNLEIARVGEKRFGWGGAAIQTLSAAYGLARIWDADFGNIQDELDKAAISGFIAGYISTKGALTLRSMSNGLPWTKAIAESGFGVEAAAGAYAIARVTEVVK